MTQFEADFDISAGINDRTCQSSLMSNTKDLFACILFSLIILALVFNNHAFIFYELQYFVILLLTVLLQKLLVAKPT